MQVPHDHDQKRLKEEPLGVNDGASPRAACGRRWGGDAVHQLEELDKDAILTDHEGASEKRVYGHKPFSEALLVRTRRVETISYL
jgi:hypothetical protein